MAFMDKKVKQGHTFLLLRQTIYILESYQDIWVPAIIILFIQLLVLELLYFAPRYPLSTFFGPIVQTFWGEKYLHYPFNLIELAEQFQLAQIPIYIFFSNYLMAVAIAVITDINRGQKIILGKKFIETLRMYVSISMAACVISVSYVGLIKLYDMVVQQASLIDPQKGILYVVKMIVVDGAPYLSLLIGIFITTLFAFVLPIIVIEKGKFFKALALNFRMIVRSFWLVLAIVILAHVPFGTILLLRTTIVKFSDTVFPELRVIILVISLTLLIVIDTMIYTAMTIYYLFKKETT